MASDSSESHRQRFVPLHNEKLCLWIHTMIRLCRGDRVRAWVLWRLDSHRDEPAGLREGSAKLRTPRYPTHMGSRPQGRHCFQDRKQPWIFSLRLFVKENAEWKCSTLPYVHSAQPQEGPVSLFVFPILAVPLVFHSLALCAVDDARLFSN